MIQAARVSLSLERTTLKWAAALTVLLAVGMLVALGGMYAAIGGRGCDVDFTGAQCARLHHAFLPWEQTGQLLIGLLWLIPTGLGALLGVAVTAGEIERRTAQISWPLARTRMRWLLVRAIPVALLLAVMLTVAAGVAEIVTRGRLMTDDPGFHAYQLRSLLVPARGLLAFAIGLAFGALIGRQLPALVVALAFSVAVTAGLHLLIDTWHLTAATWIPLNDPSWDTAVYPLVVIPTAVSGPAGEGFWTIPVADYWIWVLREAALAVLATIGACVVAARYIHRRSP